MWNRKSRSRIIIIVLTFIVSAIFLLLTAYNNSNTLLLSVLSDRTRQTIAKATVNDGKIYFKLPDKIVEPELPDAIEGESNSDFSGLNLLLLNNLTTESYVKEMLLLYNENAEGKLNEYQYHLALESLLGMQANESGFYNGTLVLESYIPFEDGQIQWNQPWGNFPAEVMTLKQINKNVINTYTVSGNSPNVEKDSGKLPYTINGINKTLADTEGAWRDLNVFQSRYTHYSMFGGSTKPSKLSGYNESNGRQSDPWYLPDNLAYLDQEFTDIINTYSVDSSNKTSLAVLYSINHNGGSAVLQYHPTFGVPYAKGPNKVGSVKEFKDEYKKSLEELIKDFANYGDKYPKLNSFLDANQARVAGVFGLLAEGWSLSQQACDTISGYRNIEKAYSIITGKEETRQSTQDYLQSKVALLPFSAEDSQNVYGLDKETLNGNSFGSMFKVSEETSTAYKNKMSDGSNPKRVHMLNVINVGHVHSTVHTGGYIYAAMLKYAGIGVDPTNPETYLKKYENEWTPDGETDWIKQYGINTDIMTPEATRVFNIGKEFLGSWYAWGGVTPPWKENGTWVQPVVYDKVNDYAKPGFDCSGFTQYVFKKAFGTDISRTTRTQPFSSYLKEITLEEAKPGDLVYIAVSSDKSTMFHTGIFAGNLDDSRILLFHAPRTGDVIKVAPYRKHKYMWYYRHVDMYK